MKTSLSVESIGDVAALWWWLITHSSLIIPNTLLTLFHTTLSLWWQQSSSSSKSHQPSTIASARCDWDDLSPYCPAKQFAGPSARDHLYPCPAHKHRSRSARRSGDVREINQVANWITSAPENDRTNAAIISTALNWTPRRPRGSGVN